MGRGKQRLWGHLMVTLLHLAGDNSFLTPLTEDAAFWERYAEKIIYLKNAKGPKSPAATVAPLFFPWCFPVKRENWPTRRRSTSEHDALYVWLNLPAAHSVSSGLLQLPHIFSLLKPKLSASSPHDSQCCFFPLCHFEQAVPCPAFSIALAPCNISSPPPISFVPSFFTC